MLAPTMCETRCAGGSDNRKDVRERNNIATASSNDSHLPLMHVVTLPSSVFEASLELQRLGEAPHDEQWPRKGQIPVRCRLTTAVVMPPNTRDDGSVLAKTSPAMTGFSGDDTPERSSYITKVESHQTKAKTRYRLRTWNDRIWGRGSTSARKDV